MGKWNDLQEQVKEGREREKARKENLGKFFYDLAKLTFAGVVICGVIPLYKNPNDKPARMATAMSGLYKWAYHRFYIDEVYQFITHKIIFNGICSPIAWFDRHVVDGTMNMFAWLTQTVSYKIRGLQSGQLQSYAWIFLMGALVIALLVICL